MLGCSDVDCVGIDDAGKVVRVRRGDDDMEAAVSRFFLCLMVWKNEGFRNI